MGKPARWLKNVLLGKKPSKSNGSKEKERSVNGKEVVVVSKIEQSDIVSDLPIYTSGMVETRNLQHEKDEMQLSEVLPPDSQDAACIPDDLVSESERNQLENAAITVQAVFRGYLARRAFWALKGIIRLQALIRGHIVRRQAVSKMSVLKVPTSNLDSHLVARTSFEFEKPKLSFRKVSTNRSLGPPPAAENPQVDLEMVKRGLRKVHNPVVENSIQSQPVQQKDIKKPNPAMEEPLKNFDVEQPEELIHTHGPFEKNEALDSTLESKENALDEEHEEEERTPKQNVKENQKSGKGSSAITTQTTECHNGNETSSPQVPSYMQATKSAKAKLRLQGSYSPKQQETEKATRRYSLPSSGNNARVTSHSPKTTRISNSGKKKTEKGHGKTIMVEWKR